MMREGVLASSRLEPDEKETGNLKVPWAKAVIDIAD